MKKRTYTIAISLASALWTASTALAQIPALESGVAIPSGTEDGRGPLAVDAINSEPLGAAHVFGGVEPDLFVKTGRHGQNKGLFLYKWVGRGPHDEPVFEALKAVAYPFDADHPPDGHIIEMHGGEIHGLWITGGAAVDSVFDSSAMRFEERSRIRLSGLPRGAQNGTALLNPDGTVELVLDVGDGVQYRPASASWRDEEYDPYDGRGIWRGGLPYVALYAVTLPRAFEGPAENPRLVSTTEREVRFGFCRLTAVDLGEGHRRDVIGGSRMGNFSYYHNTAAQGIAFEPRAYVVGQDGIARRHSTINATPVAYPNPESGLSDFIVGGEGGLYWYRFSGEFNAQGKPVYEDAWPVLEENAKLYAGSLPVTNCVDWDGDGDKDLVAGNSEGFILFFENRGDNAAPKFLPGVRLEADGHAIHVQPGYRLDIQGPSEARWGYVCPTVVDWNQDGLLDIVMSDSTARHTVFINEGTPTAPRLARGEPIYYDGLDMYSMWRVQPAVGLLGDRMAYITLDEDDELHLYWQVDARNVTDGFKLHDESGKTMLGNCLDAGGTGRLKLVLADWDLDGVKDLIVGTPRHGSIPDVASGLPQSLGRPGAAVLFVKNVGTESAPVFAYPKILAYRGEPMYFGGHACGPALADFGDPEGPGLIIGEEGGRFLYFRRSDLTLFAPDPTGFGAIMKLIDAIH